MMLQKRASTRRFLLLALAIASTISAPLAAQNARAATTAKSFLWRVESATGALYLAGSVHALSADIYPLNPVFEKAFSASDTLVEEINLGEMNQLAGSPLAILGKGMFQDGRTFDQVVSRETAALVAERVK